METVETGLQKDEEQKQCVSKETYCRPLNSKTNVSKLNTKESNWNKQKGREKYLGDEENRGRERESEREREEKRKVENREIRAYHKSHQLGRSFSKFPRASIFLFYTEVKDARPRQLLFGRDMHSFT